MPFLSCIQTTQPYRKGIPGTLQLLLCCLLVNLLQPVASTSSSRTQFLQFVAEHQSGSSALSEEAIDVIVMLQSRLSVLQTLCAATLAGPVDCPMQEATAEALHAICNPDATIFARYAAAANMSTLCHLAGLCRHVYTERMSGVAGFFTPHQLIRLLDCLPADSIDFVEQDYKVHKAEGPRPARSRQADSKPTAGIRPGRKLKGADHTARPSTEWTVGQTSQGEVQATDGSSQQTTDPQLVALTNEFMPASTISDAGLQSSMYTTAYVTPTASSGGNASGSPNSVQAAEGPTPQSSWGMSPYMAAGIKAQQLHTAQWNLDRVDQSSPVLNQTYLFGNSSQVGSGRGVNIYTLDSGIRHTHQEFQPWTGTSQRVSIGPSFATDSKDSQDCDGHGTHIASTAAGRSVGVAKEANIIAVRVLDCAGAGQVSDVVAGLEWLALNYRAPAVVTMSLGVKAGSWSQTLQSAVSNLIDNHGITVVVATGNAQVDACQITPANVNGTLAVAGSDMSSKFGTSQGNSDILYEYDNTGSCVDVFAPGVDIMAACGGAGRCNPLNDSNYAWASGTSMAVPHVAAAAAIYLEQHPDAHPAAVAQAITDSSSLDLLSTDGMLPGTPNRLLFIDRNAF